MNGNSTIELLHRRPRSYIVCVDLNPIKSLKRYEDKLSVKINLDIIVADILSPPLRRDSIDLLVFHFILHEIDPGMHTRVMEITKQLTKYILIVEPLPEGCELYQRFWHIWRKAMRTIGRHEEYRSIDYWVNLLEKCGFTIVLEKIVSWRRAVPHEELKNIIEKTAIEWASIGVYRDLIDELYKILEEAKEKRFRWSDIAVLLAEYYMK